jgi:hypothetical protein
MEFGSTGELNSNNRNGDCLSCNYFFEQN